MPAFFAIPGALSTLTGGYGYGRRVLAEAVAIGFDLRHLELPSAFPYPGTEDLAATRACLAATASDSILLVDGLAFGALPAELIASLGRRIVTLVHHPLGLEAGLDAATAAQLVASERAALAKADHVIVTSASTAETLVADFAVARDRLTVAEPGTEAAVRAAGSSIGTTPRLLAVGSLVPRKGYDILIAALAGLAHLPWTLDIVGAGRDAALAGALRDQVVAAGLDARIRFLGELDGEMLDPVYARADVFVSASLYEGYGMALCEAMARGLAIVASTGGAAARTVPDDAALKVAPGDVIALREALRTVLSDTTVRRTLAAAAWRRGQELPTWRTTTERIAAVLGRLDAEYRSAL